MAGKESLSIQQTPHVRRLAIGEVFERLTPKEKLYAHHMARAAWYGTRIILRQVSVESSQIFDLILSLHRSCDGNWAKLAGETGVSLTEMDYFLEYVALFLANIGNYYGHGDQKFIPRIKKENMEKILSVSRITSEILEQVLDTIFAEQPSSLGFPSDMAHSSYYPGELHISREEIAAVSKTLHERSISPENTRISKRLFGDEVVFEVLQGSGTVHCQPCELRGPNSEFIRIIQGDHSRELGLICESLDEARKYTANSRQSKIISEYQESFRTGDMQIYKQSQISWVQDIKPAVETVLGFIEPYRDPFGARAEFEGIVAVVDSEETEILTSLVTESATFIRRLPWAQNVKENNGKGPFERDLFESPDFTSVHALAYCSSIIFLGINLPNYNDIRQTVGFKNLMIANRNGPLSERDIPPFIDSSEEQSYIKHSHHAWKLQITIHELLGHGTGKLLTETGPAEYNFDISNPPKSPLTGKPITTWYRLGETWNSMFGDIAASLDECRAESVGSYLMTDKDLLAIFGFTDNSSITADDLTYTLYLQLGVLGLRSLESFILNGSKWGQAHDRAHFAMFRCLLSAGDGFMTVDCDPSANKLTVRVDRSKILSHGKPAIGELLLKLHIYRCTADTETCRAFYEDLTRPDDIFLEWRRIVLANKRPKQLFVQANTFIEHGQVYVKEYEHTIEGLIQSWAERAV